MSQVNFKPNHLVPAGTPSGTAVKSFNYDTLPAKDADALRKSVAVIRAIQRDGIVEVGNHLRAAKARLKHGAFLAWIEIEFGMSARQAQRCMRAAELAGKYDQLSHLPGYALQALSARTTPSAVVDEVIAAAERGEMPPAARR